VSRISPTAERPAGLRGRVRGAVRTLNPGYLALVMATGIVSVAMSAVSNARGTASSRVAAC
jgi:hypothetical protein